MLTIDTLELSEDLKKGGFDENQTATLGAPWKGASSLRVQTPPNNCRFGW